MIDDNPLWVFINPARNAANSDIPESCEADQFDGAYGGYWQRGEPNFGRVGTNLPGGEGGWLDGYLDSLPIQDAMRTLIERCLSHYQNANWAVPDGALARGGPAVEAAAGCDRYPCSDPVFDKKTVRGPLYDIERSARFSYVPELTGAIPNGTSEVTFRSFRPVFLRGHCQGNNNCDAAIEPGFGMTGNGDFRGNNLLGYNIYLTMLPTEVQQPRFLRPDRIPVVLVR